MDKVALVQETVAAVPTSSEDFSQSCRELSSKSNLIWFFSLKCLGENMENAVQMNSFIMFTLPSKTIPVSVEIFSDFLERPENQL